MVRGEEGRGRGRGRHVVREGRRPVWWGKGRGETHMVTVGGLLKRDMMASNNYISEGVALLRGVSVW